MFKMKKRIGCELLILGVVLLIVTPSNTLLEAYLYGILSGVISGVGAGFILIADN